MNHTAKNFSTAIMSAVALAALGVVPLVISIYMFAVMGQSGFVSGSMVILAAFLGFIGLGLAAGCVYTIWWAFTKSHKKEPAEAEDDSWKNMPYPKD